MAPTEGVSKGSPSRHEPSTLAKPNPPCPVCVCLRSLLSASVLQIRRSDHKTGCAAVYSEHCSARGEQASASQIRSLSLQTVHFRINQVTVQLRGIRIGRKSPKSTAAASVALSPSFAPTNDFRRLRAGCAENREDMRREQRGQADPAPSVISLTAYFRRHIHTALQNICRQNCAFPAALFVSPPPTSAAEPLRAPARCRGQSRPYYYSVN